MFGWSDAALAACSPQSYPGTMAAGGAWQISIKSCAAWGFSSVISPPLHGKLFQGDVNPLYSSNSGIYSLANSDASAKITYVNDGLGALSDSFSLYDANDGITIILFSVVIGPAGPTITLSPPQAALSAGIITVAYSQTITAAGGTASYTYTATGLPAGLTLDSLSGALSGTPTAVGTSNNIAVTAQDANHFSTTKTYSLVIAAAPTIVVTPTPATLMGGTANVAYTNNFGASGGTASYTYTATGLPAGLTLDPSSGVLSGTPTAAGTFNSIAVTARDANNFSTTKPYSLVIAAPTIVVTP
ncbi:putative Ig domain-containing protein, partial [Glaciimonas sp. GG7]